MELQGSSVIETSPPYFLSVHLFIHSWSAGLEFERSKGS